jgi:hypothetical protein
VPFHVALQHHLELGVGLSTVDMLTDGRPDDVGDGRALDLGDGLDAVGQSLVHSKGHVLDLGHGCLLGVGSCTA